MPLTGRADHDIVLVEYDIKAKRVLQSPHKVFCISGPICKVLKDHMRVFADRFMSQDFTHINVNDMWIEFKTVFLKAVDKFIPSKMTKGKPGYPWIDARIRALVRKKEKIYHKARKSNDDSLTSHYKRLGAYVQKETRDAYWIYVSNIFIPSETDTNIEGCTRNDRPKRFWSFMKTWEETHRVCPALGKMQNGILKTGNIKG